MASFGGARELVLLVGDAHIPQRAPDIDERFKKILVPNKVQQVICTGNLTSADTLEYLRSLAPKTTVVRGDFDDDDSLPETKVVRIGGFRVAALHGHQVVPHDDTEALAAVARTLDADIVVSGHTHKTSIVEYEGKLYINPGSITGAFTSTATLGDTHPAFVLMSVAGTDVELFRYELVRGELKITRSYFSKGGSLASQQPNPTATATGAAAPAGPSTAAIAASGGIAGPSAYRPDML